MNKKNTISKSLLTQYSIPSSNFHPYGSDSGKIDPVFNSKKKAKHILVTAINPTTAGEGKTTCAICIADALNSLNKKTILCLRQPSIGPTLGMKGGATGNGKSEVVPSQLINYGLNGDFFIIETIHNLIASIIENNIYFDSALNIDPNKILWNRVIDLNDRGLRDIQIKIKKDLYYHSSFDITPASEIMAIFCLSKNIKDFKDRVNNIIVAYNKKNKPVRVKDFKLNNQLDYLIEKLFQPNVVKTKENTLTLMHGGPFANIAHGCNSLVALQTADHYAKTVITEAGFGADLGCEKYIDIISSLYAQPDAIIFVITLKAVINHAKANKDIKKQIDDGLRLVNQHLKTIKNYGYDPIVVINQFKDDNLNQLKYLEQQIKNQFKVNVFKIDPVNQGKKSATALAKYLTKLHLVKKVKRVYQLNEPLDIKIQKIVHTAYGLKTKVKYAKLAASKLKTYKNLPYYVCMAKTPYSMSSDQTKVVFNENDEVLISDFVIAHGAQFIIPITGTIFRMPGLPKVPNVQK